MKKIYLILLIFFFSNNLLFSQETEQDSLWNFETLNPDDLEFEYEVEESHGFFPSAMPYNFKLGLLLGGAVYNHTKANNLRSQSLVPTIKAFNSYDIDDDDERIISKKNVNEDYGSEYPETHFGLYGLSLQYSMFLPFYLISDLAYTYRNDMLMFEDRSKGFVDYDGKYKNFKEYGFLYLSEQNFDANIGIRVPIYGGYIQMSGMKLESIYYLDLKYGFSYSLDSRATQFMQMANYNDKLRYDNGQDTLRLISEKELSSLNKFRDYAEIGTGWMWNTSGVGMDFNLSYRHALRSVLKDAEWKQNSFLFNFRIYLGN